MKTNRTGSMESTPFSVRAIVCGVILTVAAIGLGTAAAQDKPGDTAAKADDAKPAQERPTAPAATDAPLTQSGIAEALLGSLSAEHLKSVGQMLEQDWKDRPEWGDMALAVMKGERMRPGMGWWRPALKRYDWNWLRGHFDRNGDGRVDHDELAVGETKYSELFARLDRDLDGKLTAADFDYSDQSAGMSPAAMQGMMSSQVFRRLDADSNGRISADEWVDFFVRADREGLSFLAPDDLLAGLYDPDLGKSSGRSDEPPASKMLQMLLSGQMGSLTSGPEYGEKVPDFVLPTHDGKRQVTLSDSFGKRPVVLVFGSFT